MTNKTTPEGTAKPSNWFKHKWDIFWKEAKASLFSPTNTRFFSIFFGVLYVIHSEDDFARRFVLVMFIATALVWLRYAILRSLPLPMMIGFSIHEMADGELARDDKPLH